MLVQARDKNKKLEITGLLAYLNGEFIQIIEGPEESIKSLIATISADNRHENVNVFWESKIANGGFSNWEMAFVNLKGDETYDIPGYSDFAENGFEAGNINSTPNVGRDLMIRLSKTLV